MKHPQGNSIDFRSASQLIVAVAGTLLLAAAPLAADWLVMRDGSRLQIQGPWNVDGERILFEIKGGTLGSVQADDVDLDASRRLTEAAQRAADERAQPKAAPPKKKATFVLTDADVGHGSSGEGSPGVDEDEAADDTPQAQGDVTVASWNTSDLPAGNGLRLVGSVRNGSGSVAAGLTVAVLAYDSTDELILSAPASLGARAIGPGQSTTLAAELVGVFDYSRVEFDVGYIPLESNPEAAPATSTQRPAEGENG